VKVLIADKFEESGIDALQELGCEVHTDPSLGPETLHDALASSEPEVLVVRSTRVPAEVIDSAEALRLIVRAGAGTDNIDTAAAAAKGIPVCNCPGMNAIAVAELTMGLLLSCDRRIPEQSARLHEGHWDKGWFSKAKGLKGSRLGVVGFGFIGREVARRALAFDMEVVAWSRSLTPERAAEAGVEFGGNDRPALIEMVGTCDAVTIHVAGAAETENLCDHEFFEAMPEQSYFINTSRGSVVDEDALGAAMDLRGIRVGVDVYRGQPSDKAAEWTWPHVRHPQIAASTHHIGASTQQAQEAVANEVARLVGVFMRTGRAENCVNEDQLAGKPAVVSAGRQATTRR